MIDTQLIFNTICTILVYLYFGLCTYMFIITNKDLTEEGVPAIIKVLTVILWPVALFILGSILLKENL